MKKKKFKVVALPKATKTLIGMTVPEQKNGNVGLLVEDVLIDIGYPLDKQATVDIEELQVECKTRTKEARSALQIGTMTVNDIINTPYHSSSIKEKFQQQFRVIHSDIFRIITSARIYDFSDSYIQKLVERDYELGRQKFIEFKDNDAEYPNYVRGENADFYWEKKEHNSYEFRASKSAMQQYEQLANSTPIFNSLFEKKQDK